MDAQSIAVALSVLAALVVGAFVARRAGRASERLLEDSLQRLQQEHAQARVRFDAARLELDRARDEVARLAERASRIVPLEEELQARTRELRLASEELTRVSVQSGEARAMLEEKNRRIPVLEDRVRESAAQLEAAQAGAAAAKEELAQVRATLESERAQTEAQIALLQEAKTELSNQFKALAAEILDEKSKRFVETNQAAIGTIMDPLRERISDFRAKVEEIHAKDLEQQAALKVELAQLKELNRQITEEAHGLAIALKGQAKKQGNWGELVLANVLDRAGLVEGKDYRREVSFETEEGRRRPDVVLSLPQGKHLVIDAKASLNAYTRYVNAEEPAARELALREHVAAIAARIQELSDRRYFDLPGLNSPEMVFMFIPIESAFVEALRADESLFQRAIERNILVATPTTLLTSLNIVRQLWRFEEQNRHTAVLSDRASKVYAKLVTFIDSMGAVGKQLGLAQESYRKAMGQLVEGRGNLVSQAKEFEQLGVAVKAQLPQELVDRAALELDFTPRPIPFRPADDLGPDEAAQ